MLDIFRRTPFSGHRGTISGIAISPDGSEAATSAFSHQFLDHGPIVWRMPIGKLLQRLRGHQAGAFSVAYAPDGNIVATGI